MCMLEQSRCQQEVLANPLLPLSRRTALKQIKKQKQINKVTKIATSSSVSVPTSAVIYCGESQGKILWTILVEYQEETYVVMQSDI